MNSLKELRLYDNDIVLESDGYGEFPNVYKLTSKGIDLIKKVMLSNIKGELELSKNPKEYSDSITLESIKCLINQM
jgi:hypothetical protein